MNKKVLCIMCDEFVNVKIDGNPQTCPNCGFVDTVHSDSIPDGDGGSVVAFFLGDRDA